MTYETDVPNTKSEGVRAEGLGKRFGDFWALRDLDLDVPAGTVLGLLGHNGAGKTTAIRILTTLSKPTTGRASVAGHDVTDDPSSVRRKIGVAAQASTVDGLLTGRANLEMIGRLYGLSARDAKARAAELLEKVNITDSADKLVKEYSGGMRRRVDLAAGLVAAPSVLFLDEPTTGLDPQSRNDLWAILRDHVDHGGTLVLTTQYLEEADRLADRVAVLDHGRVIAEGTPEELKRLVPGGHIRLRFDDPRELELAAAALGDEARRDESLALEVPSDGSVASLRSLFERLDAEEVAVSDLSVHTPDLDDVFLALTGSGS